MGNGVVPLALVLATAGTHWLSSASPRVFGGPFFYCPDTFYMTVYRVGTAGCPKRIKTT